MDLFNIIVDWDWCSQPGVINVINMVKTVINIVRIIVPIGLIVMTTMDIVKKVINPDDKDGQKKIMIRAIAALIVFMIPTLINFVFKIIDWGAGNDGSASNPYSGISRCGW